MRRSTLPLLRSLGLGFLLGWPALTAACLPPIQTAASPPDLRPQAAPTATPRPWDVVPPGAQLTPYIVQRIALDTLPFPANTLALANLTAVYNGDGTWTVRTVIGERVPDPASADPRSKRQTVYTRFVWTIADRDRSILGLNPEGQRWMEANWHPWP